MCVSWSIKGGKEWVSDTLGELLIDQGEQHLRLCRTVHMTWTLKCPSAGASMSGMIVQMNGWSCRSYCYLPVAVFSYTKTVHTSWYIVFCLPLYRCMFLTQPVIPLSRVSPPKAPQPQLPVATAERCLQLALFRKNPQYAWVECTECRMKRWWKKDTKNFFFNIF